MTPDERAHDDGAGGRRRASDVARDRLGADLSSEMAATRAAWTDALLRSDAALRHGRPEDARRALDDQRQLLVQLHRRLDRAVSSALVEREAEYALQGGEHGLAALSPAHDGDLLPDETAAGAGAAVEIAGGTDADDRRGLRRLPRALTGATAAAVVGVVALLLGSAPPPTPEITAMDERATVEQDPPEVFDLEIDDDAAGLSAPPADELRGLAVRGPVAEPEAEEPDPEPRPEPADDTAEVVPTDEVEVDDDATRGDAEDAAEDPRPRDRDAAGRDDAEPRDEDDAPDADTDEGDEDEEGLTERLRDPLPRIDQSIAERFEKHIEGLRGQ